MKNIILFSFWFAFAGAVSAQTPGSRDSTFGVNGLALPGLNVWNASTAMVIQPDEKILVAGYLESNGRSVFAVLRFLSSGSLDDTFGQGGIAQAYIDSVENQAYAIALQPDGKILVAGYAKSNGTLSEDAVLLRFAADGTLDDSFNDTGIVVLDISPTDRFYALALQADGRILAAGKAMAPDKPGFMIARFGPDGSLDTGYGVNGYTLTTFGSSYDVCLALALQPDGKAVLGGVNITNNSNNGSFALARYDTTGMPDATFGVNGKRVTTLGTNATSSVSALAIHPDGKILAAGTSIDAGYSPGNIGLVRYKTTGTPDFTFGVQGKVRVNVGTYSTAESVALLPDGKILVAGRGDRSLTKSDLALTQFLPNGVIDSSFGVNGTYFTDVFNNHDGASAIALQPDGKIVVAGTGFKLGTKRTSIALTRFIPNLSVGIIEAPMPLEAPLVYPNPVTTASVTVRYVLPEAMPVVFEFYSMDGKRLYVVENSEQAAGEQTTELAIPTGLERGSYVLNTKTLKGNAAVRIMIQRD